MIRLLRHKRFSPIGVDVGARGVKLVQVAADQSRAIETSRWESPVRENAGDRLQEEQLSHALKMARVGKNFHGNEAVLCLSSDDLFLQNVRVEKVDPAKMDDMVYKEVADRLPFPAAHAEIRYIEAGDVRQGDVLMREVIVMACERTAIDKQLNAVEQAGLTPIALDIEPLALARSYVRQLRRNDDRQQRAMLVHVGYSRTATVIAQDEDLLFVKYIDVGGQQMDEAVAEHLQMELSDAADLRRHNGDRRADQQDPDISASVSKAVRPIYEHLASELSKCIRYHNVTFRGQPLVRVSLSGGEATPQICQLLDGRLNVNCELSNALRGTANAPESARCGHWDVAMGLALREVS